MVLIRFYKLGVLLGRKEKEYFTLYYYTYLSDYVSIYLRYLRKEDIVIDYRD